MKKLSSSAVVALLALSAPLAQAATEISYSVNGGALVTCASVAGNVANCLGGALGGGITALAIGANSNSPGTASLSQLFTSTLQVTSGAAATLEVWLASNDFTQPVTPPDITFSSNLAVTSTTGIGTVDQTACVDTSNGLTDPFCSAGYTLASTQIGYNGIFASSDTVSTNINSLSASFALSTYIKLVLGAGSNVNVITSAILTPVPEPTSILLLGTALLGATALLRKRAKTKRS